MYHIKSWDYFLLIFCSIPIQWKNTKVKKAQKLNKIDKMAHKILFYRFAKVFANIFLSKVDSF